MTKEALFKWMVDHDHLPLDEIASYLADNGLSAKEQSVLFDMYIMRRY